MTKSEAEYERKQRNARLSWIENEIRGLQRLKRLLLYLAGRKQYYTKLYTRSYKKESSYRNSTAI